ncbi:hypothetical protein LXL04_036719 [Taraxacum kok-saghyz]
MNIYKSKQKILIVRYNSSSCHTEITNFGIKLLLKQTEKCIIKIVDNGTEINLPHNTYGYIIIGFPFAIETLSWILNWCNISHQDFASVPEIVKFAASWGHCPKRRKILHAILYGYIWFIWRSRNDLVSPTKLTDTIITSESEAVFEVADGGMSVCDIEEVHRENGVGRAVYGSVLFIAADPPATTVPYGYLLKVRYRGGNVLTEMIAEFIVELAFQVVVEAFVFVPERMTKSQLGAPPGTPMAGVAAPEPPQYAINPNKLKQKSGLIKYLDSLKVMNTFKLKYFVG